MLKFSLPVIDERSEIENLLGAELSGFITNFQFEVNCYKVEFTCESEEIANNIVNTLYGPEEDREPNSFWIY